jgi:hypothetical protein
MLIYYPFQFLITSLFVKLDNIKRDKIFLISLILEITILDINFISLLKSLIFLRCEYNIKIILILIMRKNIKREYPIKVVIHLPFPGLRKMDKGKKQI